MKKKIFQTSEAPAPIGPYNQAVASGNLLFISGQIPMDPHTGELISGSIEAETRQVMENLRAILREAGADFDSVIKSSIFITDMGLFSRINEVYGSYFESETAPARETVQVAGLPRGVQVEISVIAALGE